MRLLGRIGEPITEENLSFRQQREPERRSNLDVLISGFFPVTWVLDSQVLVSFILSLKRESDFDFIIS